MQQQCPRLACPLAQAAAAGPSRVPRSTLGPGASAVHAAGGIFKSAAVEVLRAERRLMSTGEITRCAGPRAWMRAGGCRGGRRKRLLLRGGRAGHAPQRKTLHACPYGRSAAACMSACMHGLPCLARPSTCVAVRCGQSAAQCSAANGGHRPSGQWEPRSSSPPAAPLSCDPAYQGRAAARHPECAWQDARRHHGVGTVHRRQEKGHQIVIHAVRARAGSSGLLAQQACLRGGARAVHSPS